MYPQCQDCIYKVLLKMPVVGRLRLPRGVEGSKAVRSKGEEATLIFLQVFFWNTAAEFNI